MSANRDFGLRLDGFGVCDPGPEARYMSLAVEGADFRGASGLTSDRTQQLAKLGALVTPKDA